MPEKRNKKEPPVPVNAKQKISVNTTHPGPSPGHSPGPSPGSGPGPGPSGSKGTAQGPGPGREGVGPPWRRVLVTQGCVVTLEPLQPDTLYEITGKRKWWSDVEGNIP